MGAGQGHSVRVVVILAAFNESRFIEHAIEHYLRNDVEVLLIDNESTDRTYDLARPYLGHGIVEIVSRPRRGLFEWRKLLELKTHLARQTEADWYLHADPDEVRMSPNAGQSLHDALQEADHAGYNAVDFDEYTFVPTAESPDHDHAQYAQTMRWYYPFAPRRPHRLSAWKKAAAEANGAAELGLAESGGHSVAFPGLRASPARFKMKHYLILSLSHAIEKYGMRKHPAEELKHGWHQWRNELPRAAMRLPSEEQLHRYVDDEHLCNDNAQTRHLILA